MPRDGKVGAVIAVIVFVGLGLVASVMVMFVIPRFIYHGEDNPAEVRRFATKWSLVIIWAACAIGVGIGVLSKTAFS